MGVQAMTCEKVAGNGGADDAEKILTLEIRLPREPSPADRVRSMLRQWQYYPTIEWCKMMQDPKEQEAVKEGILQGLANLIPADLAAVVVVVSALAFKPED